MRGEERWVRRENWRGEKGREKEGKRERRRGKGYEQVCSHAKTYGTCPKLAETALLFCRVSDVPLLPKMEQRTIIGRNSTPRE